MIPMSNLPEKVLCGARLRGKPGQFCKKSPLQGRNRCRLHGGASPRGVDSPNWRGRGYSRDIPSRYLARLDQILEDPELAGMRQELALIDARMGELLSRLDDGDTKEAWARVEEVMNSLDDAIEAKPIEGEDPYEMLLERGRKIAGILHTTVQEHRADGKTWDELYEVVDLRRRVSQAETKREVDLSGSLTAKQAMALVAAIRAAISETVTDEAMRLLLNQRIFTQILNRPQLASEVEEAEFEVVSE